MKLLSWFGLILVVSPLFAFGSLAVLYPVGDPQDSHNMLIRMLDFQGTYWMRNSIPVPPPLLLAGFVLSLILRKRHHLSSAKAGTILGYILLGLWSLIMVVQLLIHVN
jgi:hypothetical protein